MPAVSRCLCAVHALPAGTDGHAPCPANQRKTGPDVPAAVTGRTRRSPQGSCLVPQPARKRKNAGSRAAYLPPRDNTTPLPAIFERACGPVSAM